MTKVSTGTVQLSTNGTPIIDHAATLTLEQIRKYFSFPLHEACVKLNVDQVALNRRCRILGIKRWPYRRRADSVSESDIMDFTIRTDQTSYATPSNTHNGGSSSTGTPNMFHTFRLDGSPGTPKTAPSFSKKMSSPMTPTSLNPYGAINYYQTEHYPSQQYAYQPYGTPTQTHQQQYSYPYSNQNHPQQLQPNYLPHIHHNNQTEHAIPLREPTNQPPLKPTYKNNEDGSSPHPNIVIPAPTKVSVPSLLIQTKKRPRVGLSIANMGADDDMCESPVKKAHMSDEAECGRENTPSSTDTTTPTLNKTPSIITKCEVGEQILPGISSSIVQSEDGKSSPLTVVTTTITTPVTTMDPMLCSPASPNPESHTDTIDEKSAFTRKT